MKVYDRTIDRDFSIAELRIQGVLLTLDHVGREFEVVPLNLLPSWRCFLLGWNSGYAILGQKPDTPISRGYALHPERLIWVI